MSLHVYYDNNSEWVVAESPEEAQAIWMKEMGMTEDDIDSDELLFEQWPDDKEMGVRFEYIPEGMTDEEANEWLDQDPENGWKKLTKTCGEWAKKQGKGCLCSSEF
jgi:hypothetical protein